MSKQKNNNQEFDIEEINYDIKCPDEYEGENPERYSVRAWWSVLQANSYKSHAERVKLYERALTCIPQCYKIWYNYLQESIDELESVCILSKRYQKVNNLFERALEYMKRMPKIWYMYTQFLEKQHLITKTRQTFDQCLRSLPITQHEDIWIVYTEWALKQTSISTFQYVSNRFLLLDKNFKDEIVEYYLNQEQYNNAAITYHEMIEDDRFASQKYRNKFEIYMDLCNLIDQHPLEITSVDCEKIIREGLNKYVDEVGNLWCKLADYYIRKGQFTDARTVYTEAIQKVLTARDFNIVYNAHLKFEQEMINALAMQEDEEVDEEIVNEQIDRLETLVDSRNILFIECKLRQNPNSVKDWIAKIQHYNDDINKTLELFAEAFNTVDPEQADNGKLSDLFIEFALLYLRENDLQNFNLIMEKATRQNYKTYEDSICIWKFWIENLLKLRYYKDAILVIKQAIFGDNKSNAFRASDNQTLWTLYLDLEINFGTIDSIKTAYQKILDRKLITPYILLNYTEFLQKNLFFEESFKIYEKALQMFSWPAKYDIWLSYINSFIDRYSGTKLERIRDLFEKILAEVPPKKAKLFYLMYAEYEETHGLLNHAFEIYDRMIVNVEEQDQLFAYNLYIAKVSQFMGITKSRLIFENALEVIKGSDLVKLGVRFGLLERKLGEIDRARAIYGHISQFADPRDDQSGLWKIWNDFELRHGNVDTMKDYIRIKKSVVARFQQMPFDVKKIKEKVDNEAD